METKSFFDAGREDGWREASRQIAAKPTASNF
jgi:hypothetical protein